MHVADRRPDGFLKPSRSPRDCSPRSLRLVGAAIERRQRLNCDVQCRCRRGQSCLLSPACGSRVAPRAVRRRRAASVHRSGPRGVPARPGIYPAAGFGNRDTLPTLRTDAAACDVGWGPAVTGRSPSCTSLRKMRAPGCASWTGLRPRRRRGCGPRPSPTSGRGYRMRLSRWSGCRR